MKPPSIIRRPIVQAAAVVVFTIGAAAACTPTQMRAYIAWHEADPAGAEQWLTSDEGQATLDDTSTSDGPQFADWLTNRHNGSWTKIAMCESGGNWAHPPVTNRHGTFSGGVMIMHTVWRHYGGTQFASAPYLASKAEQIEIAERILADVGWSAWQCAA